jgi:hypothetical protein
MNRDEKRILGPLIKAVVHHNEHKWWELKRAIWDGSGDAAYFWQSEFRNVAERGVARLPDGVRREVLDSWRSTRPTRASLSEEEILHQYVLMIEEEVVARATTAAYPTTEW